MNPVKNSLVVLVLLAISTACSSQALIPTDVIVGFRGDPSTGKVIPGTVDVAVADSIEEANALNAKHVQPGYYVPLPQFKVVSCSGMGQPKKVAWFAFVGFKGLTSTGNQLENSGLTCGARTLEQAVQDAFKTASSGGINGRIEYLSLFAGVSAKVDLTTFSNKGTLRPITFNWQCLITPTSNRAVPTTLGDLEAAIKRECPTTNLEWLPPGFTKGNAPPKF